MVRARSLHLLHRYKSLADEPHSASGAFASLGAPAAVGRETALLALGGCRFWGEAERDDGRASVNPDLFVMPTSSIRKVVVESCRWPGRVVG